MYTYTLKSFNQHYNTKTKAIFST